MLKNKNNKIKQSVSNIEALAEGGYKGVSNGVNEYKLFTDGACWGNPGKGACGMVIKDEKGKEIFKGAVYLGESTNNIAEYSALLEGLKIAHNLRILKLKVYSDSELVIKQLNGEYKVKSLNLIKLNNIILKTAKKFTSINFNYTSRGNTEIPHDMAERMLKVKASQFGRPAL